MVSQPLPEHDDTPHEDKIYAHLGVREVWYWRRGKLSAHVLSGGRYEEVRASCVLPGIDLAQLASYLDRPVTSQAIREYRAACAR